MSLPSTYGGQSHQVIELMKIEVESLQRDNALLLAIRAAVIQYNGTRKSWAKVNQALDAYDSRDGKEQGG